MKDLQTAIFIFALFLLIINFFVLWTCAFTEFSYINKNAIKLLYNTFAFIYENKWNHKNYLSENITENLFLNPVKQSLINNTNPLLLDLACGTGRMSLMIAKQNWFDGLIHSIDFSDGMLKKMQENIQKLSPEKRDKIKIFKQDLSEWTPIEGNYSVVTFMEAGEFIPNFAETVQKVYLCLKKGGLFLLTKPPDYLAWAYWGRKQTTKQITQLLKENGFDNIKIQNWTARYQVIIAYKPASGRDFD